MDEILEKIRQQFDYGPYPRISLETSPKDDLDTLFIHNLTTPYYLRYRKRPPQEVTILDAGCGSGYKALALALANPGARVVGIDLSEASIELARKRLEFHQISNCEFHVLMIENVSELGLKFDYINCDEVLTLVPNPVEILTALKQVLKAQGILRVNVHNRYQRQYFFQAQEFFSLLGLMRDNPEEFEVQTVYEIMEQLADEVYVKRVTWENRDRKSLGDKLNEKLSEFILMNHLLQGDKGFTIPEFFACLEAAGLEFIEMVHWPVWRLPSLFKDPENLPAALALAIDGASPAEILHLLNLLHPNERLLDLWCGHPQPASPVSPSEQPLVSLHPQLCHEKVQQAWKSRLQSGLPLLLSDYLKVPVKGLFQIEEVQLDAIALGALWPLFEGPQPFQNLLQRWLQLYPRDLLTLEPLSEEQAAGMLRELLLFLNRYLYVLLTDESDSDATDS
ncbi:MAG: class I SAM-dependent methyltransferase [Gloeomargarita sp. SKYBB_i_bin120]|nr:class I SAM-dependent methyltransferase [Gloeomargarita sp. SKYG98]MCS7291952.1 class I SAM-dependent methyltransferase [Gloeomargarita sp. SKYB120]MDW8177512.1 class I SAM-dependent methyltransferase [Gloeomargarita sp. SKYBB_i_bin120]